MSVDVLCLRPRIDFERANALPAAELTVAYHAPNDAEVIPLMKQARALVIPAVGPKLSSDIFDNTTVKLVQVTGAGLDRLDLALLRGMDIAVANVPGGSNKTIAEYAVSTASVLLRRFAWADAEIRAGKYEEFRARMISENLSGLEGLLVGVIGLGTIGLAVAQAFHRAGCRICYYDPAPRDAAAARALDAKSLSLDELMKSADVVTLHVPLLPATRGLISARELQKMKPGAILIQASRGGVVDEAALAEALISGHLGGAAIDVYDTEPPSLDNPLLSLTGEAARRVLFTPHIAGVTRQAAEYLFRTTWRNVEQFIFKNELPQNRVQ
ncbi:MAG TPA: NAD(P)-dependent oxidoreductase [Verrucomicrobiae bacterium]|nr:NAD(P)-dependent oxidoreductase [Verrucomicrobiae bacterium]